MYSPKLLRVEAAECRRGAVGKSAPVERTLLAVGREASNLRPTVSRGVGVGLGGHDARK